MLFEESKKIFVRRCLALSLSQNTINYYLDGFKVLEKFLTKRKITDIETISDGDILDLIVHLQKKYSPVSVADRFRGFKVFFTYLHQHGYIPISPMINLHKPKVPKVKARTFTNNEVLKIINFYNKNDTTHFYEYRNYTIMSILFGTGIRKSELLGMTVFDVHFDENIISVVGKGNKQRYIPIGILLKKILKKYMALREVIANKKENTSPALIITKNGESLSVYGLDMVFRELKENLNIPTRRLSAHTFRHTFAKNFLLNGGDIYSLQRILGHEDITTTQIYLEFNNNELRIQNDKFNPLDNTRWQYY